MPVDEEGPVQIKKGTYVGPPGRRFRIGEKLGEGGCGSVYKVVDLRSGCAAALKAENNNVAGGTVLKLEVQVLRRLKGRKYAAQLIHAGRRTDYSYMVMTLLGDSLQKLIGSRTCSISTVCRVGIQILFAVKQLHDIGYIHRDVKPANLAVGRYGREARVLHLLDFGLSREYIYRNKGTVALRHPRTDTLFRGTTRYCSANTHTRNEQGRPDDLWSMLYVLVEMRGSLPWERLTEKNAIGQLKHATSDVKLLSDCPPQMLDIAKHLRELDYYTRPDYLYIFKKFEEIMRVNNFKYTDLYDWEKSSTASTLTKKLMRTLSISEDAPEDEDDGVVEQPLLSEETQTTTCQLDATSKTTKTAKSKKVRRPRDPSNAVAKDAKSMEYFTEADFAKNELGI